METIINAQLEKAQELLDAASEALCKPAEDVVPYYICNNSQDAIVNLLSAFIQNHNREVPEGASIQELLKLSREIDPDFKQLKLAPFYHPTDTEDIWMNPDMAEDFLKMAQMTQSMVLAHLSNN